ncbi:MAG: hypothetical protein ACTSUN_00550 [Promethearchaeota archaeon]
MSERITIGLDYSHNNPLILETSSYNEFIDFLFASNYQLSKIETGFYSIEILEQYDVIILSTPINAKLEPAEIDALEEFVKLGGGLLIASSSGGDYSNNTNLNDLTSRFGFKFVSDEIFDSMNYVVLQKRLILDDIKPHVITELVNKAVFSNACSLEILENVADHDEVDIVALIHGGLNCWRKVLKGKEWVEEDSPKIPLLVACKYHEGRVVGFGTISIFSSLGREYGFKAFDNNNLIANILRWLTIKAISEKKVINLTLDMEIYQWLTDLKNSEKWETISDIVTVALKYFKDHYKKIMEKLRRMELKKYKTKQILETEGINDHEIKVDEKILNRIPNNRDKKYLEEIIKSLEEITGEKYDFSKEFLELEEKSKKKNIVEFSLLKENVKLIDKYYEEDIKKFEKETGKKAVWRGKITQTFRDWLKEQYEE